MNISNRIVKVAIASVFFTSIIGPIGWAESQNTAVKDTTPADILAIPVFDKNKDGPLLAKVKTVQLETSAGPITLYLDPSLAPMAATYIYKLLSCGAFLGTPIHRYEPNFVMQVNNVWEKGAGQSPLPENLRTKLRRVPLEISTQKTNELNHHKYVLSLARYDGNPDSAPGSFSILLGNAPHLDHQYTIFGKMGEDAGTLETLAKIENNWAPNKYWITGIK